MKKIVLKFGLISGAVLGTMTGILMPLCMNGHYKDLIYSQIVGYSAMVVAFLAVFFGIRRYRDDVGGGSISFGKAFGVGILIALIGCTMYVVGWEIAFWGFMPDFGERYAAATLAKMKAGGATPEEIATETEKMQNFTRLYKNPFFNVALTFAEVLPVAVLVTLISAAILRRRPGGGAPEAVTA